MWVWNFCDLLQNLSLCKYLFVGKTTINIIKFDPTQNKMQILLPLKCFESKMCKKIYLQIIITWYCVLIGQGSTVNFVDYNYSSTVPLKMLYWLHACIIVRILKFSAYYLIVLSIVIVVGLGSSVFSLQ